MNSVKIILTITLTALAGVFIYQNTAVMQLTFLFWSITMSASLIVLAVFFAGFISGFFLLFLSSRKKRLKTKAENME